MACSVGSRSTGLGSGVVVGVGERAPEAPGVVLQVESQQMTTNGSTKTANGRTGGRTRDLSGDPQSQPEGS